MVNIGTTPNTSTTYKLRVSGSMSATSTVQASNLRATNLGGTGERDVCTDYSGNLIECTSSISALGFHNVSAMGFHPQTSSTAAAAGFQRDIINGFVSFANNTKQTEAKMRRCMIYDAIQIGHNKLMLIGNGEALSVIRLIN